MIQNRLLMFGVIFFIILFGVLLLAVDKIGRNKKISRSVLLVITIIVTSVITLLFLETISVYGNWGWMG